MLSLLQDIEKSHNVKIIYAVEGGSRIYGLFSDKSDYDIRFIFKQINPLSYISASDRKETIIGSSDNKLYEWHGWDIIKTLQHLSTCNPNLIEWLYSPIKYIDDGFSSKCKDLLKGIQIKIPLMNQYRSILQNNWNKFITNQNNVHIKRYLNIIRSLVMMIYISKMSHGAPLILDFNKLVEIIDLEESVKGKIKELIHLKTNSNNIKVESLKYDELDILNKWVKECLENFDNYDISDNSNIYGKIENVTQIDLIKSKNDNEDGEDREGKGGKKDKESKGDKENKGDSIITKQLFVLTYGKLKECKNKLSLNLTDTTVVQKNYKEAILYALQLQYINGQPINDNKNMKIPSNINKLIETIKCPKKIIKCIELNNVDVINGHNIEFKKEVMIEITKMVSKNFGDFMSLINGNTLFEGTNDMGYLFVKNMMGIYWLHKNKGKKIKDIPDSVVFEMKEVCEKLFEVDKVTNKVMNTNTESETETETKTKTETETETKTKTETKTETETTLPMITINNSRKNLNVWFNKILIENSDKYDGFQKLVQQCKQNRRKVSTLQIDPIIIDKFIHEIIGI